MNPGSRGERAPHPARRCRFLPAPAGGRGLPLALALLLGTMGIGWAAQTVYQKPSAFIRSAFRGELPPTRALDLTRANQARIARLLGHSYRTSRIRYWTSGRRMVVILEEVGKTQPITTGFIVDGGKILQVKVLIYRESHGHEVSRASFTRQFSGASLDRNGQLTRRVNGIAGATLSVRALTGLTRVALYLDSIRPR